MWRRANYLPLTLLVHRSNGDGGSGSKLGGQNCPKQFRLFPPIKGKTNVFYAMRMRMMMNKHTESASAMLAISATFLPSSSISSSFEASRSMTLI